MDTSTIEAVDRLARQAWEVRRTNVQQAHDLAQQALQLVEEEGPYPRGEADSLRVLAWCRMHHGELEDALRLALRAFDLYEQLGHTEGETYLSYLLGAILWRVGELPQALEHTLQGLRLARSSGDALNEMGLYSILGGIYFDQQRYDEASRYAQHMLEFAEKADVPHFKADALNNLAFIGYRRGDLEAATGYIRDSLALFSELGATAGHLEALHTAGAVYSALGDCDAARRYFELGLARAEDAEIQASIIEFLLELARLALRQQEETAAVAHLQRALAIASSIRAPKYQARVHQAVAALYKALGDFEKALSHHEQFHFQEKQIYNHEADRRSKVLQILHDVENARREAEIYRLRALALEHELEERKQTEASLRDAVAVDPLTGAYNRRHFLELAEQRLAQARHLRQPVGFLIFDIDRFKQVNDSFGHLVGDRLLTQVTRRTQQAIRKDDLLGRYGGDEFLVLFVNAEPEWCLGAAERIRQQIANQPVQTERGAVSVTVSVGMTVSNPTGEETLLVLLEQADHALYQAKEAGRNQVRRWEA